MEQLEPATSSDLSVGTRL